MDILDACKASRRNRPKVSAGTACGCYFCLRVFDGAAVTEWADLDEQTALCPNCGIDSVWPGATDAGVLAAAHEHWFCERPNSNYTTPTVG